MAIYISTVITDKLKVSYIFILQVPKVIFLFKPTQHSSVLYGGTSDKAVDGRKERRFVPQSTVTVWGTMSEQHIGRWWILRRSSTSQESRFTTDNTMNCDSASEIYDWTVISEKYYTF